MHGTYRHVIISGAHSTGKTKLVQAVSASLNNLQIQTEVARNIINELQWRRDEFDPTNHPEKFFELNKRILSKQCQHLHELTGTSVLFDRGPTDALAYIAQYLGRDQLQQVIDLEETKQALDHCRSTHCTVLVITPKEECIKADNQRLVPKMQELLDYTDTLKQLLNEHQIPFQMIDCLDLNERLAIVVEKFQIVD